MIYAEAKQYSTFVTMEVIRPDKIEHDFIRVANVEAAQNKLNELCRDYIVLKMEGWLRQRTKGLERSEQLTRSITAARLGVELSYKKDSQLHVVMRFIAQHAQTIENLAPSSSAGHFRYYQDTILKIVKYCRGEEVSNG